MRNYATFASVKRFNVIIFFFYLTRTSSSFTCTNRVVTFVSTENRRTAAATTMMTTTSLKTTTYAVNASYNTFNATRITVLWKPLCPWTTAAYYKSFDHDVLNIIFCRSSRRNLLYQWYYEIHRGVRWKKYSNKKTNTLKL
jgi:hypothetical protein